MGEAKRRKKSDPNYGKPVIIGDKNDSEWKKHLCFTDRQWQKIKPHFKLVNSIDDVDDSIDGVWRYIDEEDQEKVVLTGSFISYLSDEEEEETIIKNQTKIVNNFNDINESIDKDQIRIVDSFDDIDESIDGVWKYKDKEGRQKISFTGSAAKNLFEKMCR